MEKNFKRIIITLLGFYFHIFFVNLEMCKDWPKIFGTKSGHNFIHSFGLFNDILLIGGDNYDRIFNKYGGEYAILASLSIKY